MGVWGSSDLEGLSDGEAIQALFRHRNKVDAEIQRRLHRFDKSEGYAADGALTAKAWLRWKCNLTHGQASERVEVAREMQELPKTAQALADGEISYQHASLIARTKQQLRTQWPDDAEEILVAAARQVNPVDLRRATVHLQHCLEPDGVLDDANAAHERRFLHLNQTFGGLFVLNGQFGADDGATLKAAIMSVLKPPAADDTRTPAQRRADALIDLVKSGSPKAQVMVTMDMETLQKQPGSLGAEIDWSQQPIPAETARRIACDCCLTPVLDGEMQRSTRLVSGRLRKALDLRDKHCRFPGCDIPAIWSDAHHIVHWADGGPTKLFNLLLLCRRHHRMVHEGRWQLQPAGDGLLQAVPP